MGNENSEESSVTSTLEAPPEISEVSEYEDAIQVYEKVRSGELKRFPDRYCNGDVGLERARTIGRYLAENILGLSVQGLKKIKGQQNLLERYKLGSNFLKRFRHSPRLFWEHVYPGEFEPWDFGPTNIWCGEKGKRLAAKLLRGKTRGYTDQQIRSLTKTDIKRMGGRGALRVFNNSVVALKKYIFPDLLETYGLLDAKQIADLFGYDPNYIQSCIKDLEKESPELVIKFGGETRCSHFLRIEDVQKLGLTSKKTQRYRINEDVSLSYNGLLTEEQIWHFLREYQNPSRQRRDIARELNVSYNQLSNVLRAAKKQGVIEHISVLEKSYCISVMRRRERMYRESRTLMTYHGEIKPAIEEIEKLKMNNQLKEILINRFRVLGDSRILKQTGLYLSTLKELVDREKFTSDGNEYLKIGDKDREKYERIMDRLVGGAQRIRELLD